VTFTANASCDVGDTPEYQFYELPPGGPWALAQDFTTNPQFVFDSTGAAGGTYLFQAWARAQGSSQPFESVGYGQFIVTTGPAQPCATATLTAQLAIGLPGTSQTITAATTACPNPQYAFFELPPGSSTWQLAQDFSTTATLNFTDPANGPAGDYQFQVWVKDTSSFAPFDAYSGTTYTSGVVLANHSHVTLGDGTIGDTSFHGHLCQNGLIAGFNNEIDVCTTDNGVWIGGYLNSATNTRFEVPNWVNNSGQYVLDPNSPSNTGQFPGVHGAGVTNFSGASGTVAFFTTDTGIGNFARSSTFGRFQGPLAYPGTNVVWRQDSSPSGQQIFPVPITAALIGSSTNNYLGSFDASGNTIIMHGNTIVSTIVATPLGAGVTAKVTSIQTGVVSASGPSNRDVHIAAFANGSTTQGGGIYWSCNTTGSAFAEDDNGISAGDKTLVNVLAMDQNTFSTNQAVARTCGAVTGIKDYTLVLYAGLQGGSSLYKSTDGGATWNVSNTGLPAGAKVSALAMEQTRGFGSNIYAGTDSGLYQSTDAGASWHLIGLGGKNVLAVAVTSRPSGNILPPRVFAGTDEADGLYQTFAPPGDSSYLPNSAIKCTAPATLTFSKPSPQIAGNFSEITGNAGSCLSSYYEWFMLPPGGSWQLVQAYSPRPQYDFITTAATTPGVYSFQQWARDASSTAAYDAATSFTFTITAQGVACTAGGLSPSVASPQPVGTPVTLTATSATCANPQYTFYELPPGGQWTQVQGPSSSPTLNFDTTTNGPGDYSFQVWVKDLSSSATSDTVGQMGFTLQ
jgi:hypothetical protein